MSFTFVPQFSFIASIQLGQQTVVTFTEDCDFSPGEIVSFRVSPPSGTRELNNQQATVLATTADSITVGIDSTYFTPFVFNPINNLAFPAMVVPAASGILPGSAPATVGLQDAFDNVPTT
jgi:hypothetical protein